MSLYVFDLKYAYFGLDVENGIVVKAPPISIKSIGKNIQDVIQFYKKYRLAKVYDSDTKVWI